MLIRGAEINGVQRDVRCVGGLIEEIDGSIAIRRGEEEIDAQGGALMPGLHDHHIHLLSLAAQFASTPCGPPQVETRSDLVEALHQASPTGGWLRGTGYFESVAGPLDRVRMDALYEALPLRIQHRSGAMWFLNTKAIEALGLDDASAAANASSAANALEAPDGVERDAAGRATGRLFRADTWLRDRLPPAPVPDLRRVGSFLASCGVTRLTDATPSNGRTEARLLDEAQRRGALPQRIRLMGNLSLEASDATPALEIAEHKIMLDEPALPEFEALVARIISAHEVGRCVAMHTVTRTEIHFALAALEAAGARTGDRLEHASVAPREACELAARLRISIVTQPNFVGERGDAYRRDVDSCDLPSLYRVRSWLDANVPLASGTDAPFGHPDPWRAIQAAVTRSTPSGAILGESEAVNPETAIALFLDPFSTSTTNASPGARLAAGQRADLCILDTPWHEARRSLSSDRVTMTLCGGQIVWSANA